MLTNQILPSTGWCSFLSNQLAKIQNKPLSIKVAVAVIGIFACLAIAYGCYIGISALRSRVSSQRPQNPDQELRENSETPVTLPIQQSQSAINNPNITYYQNNLQIYLSRAQCEAAMNITNACWIQVQCPDGKWKDFEAKHREYTGKYVLNVLDYDPGTSSSSSDSIDYFEVSDNGEIRKETKSLSKVQREIKNGKWANKPLFNRRTLQRLNPS